MEQFYCSMEHFHRSRRRKEAVFWERGPIVACRVQRVIENTVFLWFLIYLGGSEVLRGIKAFLGGIRPSYPPSVCLLL